MISFWNCWKSASLNHHRWNESQLGADTEAGTSEQRWAVGPRARHLPALSSFRYSVHLKLEWDRVCSVETARRELHQSGGGLLQAAARKQSFGQRARRACDLACPVTLQSRPPAGRRDTVTAPAQIPGWTQILQRARRKNVCPSKSFWMRGRCCSEDHSPWPQVILIHAMVSRWLYRERAGETAALCGICRHKWLQTAAGRSLYLWFNTD